MREVTTADLRAWLAHLETTTPRCSASATAGFRGGVMPGCGVEGNPPLDHAAGGVEGTARSRERRQRSQPQQGGGGACVDLLLDSGAVEVLRQTFG